VRFIAHQNESQTIEKGWRKELPWWISYRTHGVRLAAFIVARGNDSCSVGIVAQGWVKNPMPNWLIKLAVRYICPRLFMDLIEETERQFPREFPGEKKHGFWGW
jgi:hypothetical protein